MRNPFRRETLGEKLEKMPGHILVEEKFMAVLMPDGRILAIPGDFRNFTEEEANLKLQEILRKMQ